MRWRMTLLALLVLSAVGLAAWLFALPMVEGDWVLEEGAEAVERGAYLVTAGGCLSCHRGEGKADAMSGGLAIETDFGTLHAPNITPDPETGIGDWSATDFIRAMKHGRQPGGGFYFPAFPYRSYAGLEIRDVLDMAAYLLSRQPVRNEVPSPDVPWWLTRSSMAFWNRLADFSSERPETFGDPVIARGAYLARHLGHCGECHTPRNGLGIPDQGRRYAGSTLGGERIEAIDATALEGWSARSFALFLLIGMKPDGEFVGGDMNEVIEHNTSQLTEDDRYALAAYFTRHIR
jgi:mono/diheme cytochrome c family protein